MTEQITGKELLDRAEKLYNEVHQMLEEYKAGEPERKRKCAEIERSQKEIRKMLKVLEDLR